MDINEGLQEKRLLHIQLMSLIWTEDICKLKGLLNILVLTSHHQYWHRHFKILSLPHEKFLERDGLLSASVWYHFGTITHFYKNSYSPIWKCPLVFQKKPLTIFGNLPVKYSWQSPFEVHLKAFLWFFQKSCFSSYSEEN